MSAESDPQVERLLEQGAVLLVPEGPARLTEYGKRWLDRSQVAFDKFRGVLRDVVELAEVEARRWAQIEDLLRAEGCPTAITSGISQYGMSHLIDHLNGKTSFTMPATVTMALATTAPTSTTTAVTIVEAAYTGYARVTIAGSGFNAATAATPSIATNNGAITFGACTGGTSTLLGFMIADNATLATGNSLWYGTLASTVISTTQTPPTVATTAMSLSITGT